MYDKVTSNIEFERDIFQTMSIFNAAGSVSNVPWPSRRLYSNQVVVVVVVVVVAVVEEQQHTY